MTTTGMDNDGPVTYWDSDTESSEDEYFEPVVPPTPSGRRGNLVDDSAVNSGTSIPTAMTGPKMMVARAYQHEMYEESLKQNIIVAV